MNRNDKAMIETFRLENGVTVVVEPRPQSGRVAVQVVIGAGTINERPGMEDGLTDITVRTATLGTKSRSAADIQEETESKGYKINTYVDETETAFSTTVLTRYAADAFDLLSDIVINPSLDNTQVTYFPQESIRRKHAELISRPEKIVVSFTGDIDAATAKKLAEDHFSALQATGQPLGKKMMAFEEYDGREQVTGDRMTLQFGLQAPSIKSEDKYAALLLQELLIGGMSSLLYQEIRDKRGLVYEISAHYTPLDQSGALTIGAETEGQNARELLTSLIEVFGSIVKNGFNDTDLEKARERILRKFSVYFESAEFSAAYNASQIFLYGRPVTLEEFRQKFEQLTSDDLKHVCADMLQNDKYLLSAEVPLDTNLPAPQEIHALLAAQTTGVTLPAVKIKSATLTPVFGNAAAQISSAEPKMTVLKNGMKVVTIERPGSLSCGAWMGVGSDCETPELNGASHMIEHMMFKGTPSYPAGTVAKIIEGTLGGELNAFTANDRTVYTFDNLNAKDLEKVIDICGEMVFKANINAKDLEREKNIVIQEIKTATTETTHNKKAGGQDSLAQKQWDLILQTAYPATARARAVGGTEASVHSFNADDLKIYRDTHYTADNTVFAATGPVRHEDFVKLIEEKFGAMSANAAPGLPQNVYQGGTAFIESPAVNGCRVNFSAEAATIDHPDFYIYQLLGTIMNSSHVRQQSGLMTNIASDRNTGLFTASLGTRPDQILPAIDYIFSSLRQIAANLTQQDIDRALIALENGTLAGVEKNKGACDFYATHALINGKVSTTQELFSEVKKISVGDLQRVMGKMLDANPTVALVVPQGMDQRLIPAHKDVLVLRDKNRPSKTGRQNKPKIA